MGTFILDQEYKDRASVNINEKGGTLTIGIVKAEDAGTYVCTANSSLGISVESATVLLVTGLVPYFAQVRIFFLFLTN